MAAASSVVDLCTFADAELDAATLAKFFHDDDDDGAGGAIHNFSWPEAEKTTSKLNQGEVQNLCDKYVSGGYTPTSLDGWVACQTPPEGSICVYADALDAGMRLPLHHFYVAVLGHYSLAPSQLAPEAWGYMAAFLMLSKEAGVEPMLSAFLLLFSLCTHEGDSVGWYHFKSTPSPPSLSGGTGICIFTGNMPTFSGWESRFFFVKSPSTTPWPCAVKWGKPSRAAVRKRVLSQQTSETKTVVKELLARAGSSGIGVIQYLSGRLPLSIAPPRHKHNPVKVEAVGAAAGLPPQQQEPTRKRKSSHMRELVEGAAKMSELAGKAMAELQEKEKELQESKKEVTQLQHRLTMANRKHDDEVSKLKERAEEVKAVRAELQREHEDKVAQLTKKLEEEHACQVAKLNWEHAADIARLQPAVEKELENAMTDMVLAFFPKLGALFPKPPEASLLQPASRSG